VRYLLYMFCTCVLMGTSRAQKPPKGWKYAKADQDPLPGWKYTLQAPGPEWAYRIPRAKDITGPCDVELGKGLRMEDTVFAERVWVQQYYTFFEELPTDTAFYFLLRPGLVGYSATVYVTDAVTCSMIYTSWGRVVRQHIRAHRLGNASDVVEQVTIVYPMKAAKRRPGELANFRRQSLVTLAIYQRTGHGAADAIGEATRIFKGLKLMWDL
jgi:hypothetical protein